jgi:hypothetical protein
MLPGMRPLPRVVLPLVLGPAAPAAVAAWVVSETNHAWLLGDVGLRRAMRSLVAELDAHRWAGNVLADASRARRRDRLWDRVPIGSRAVAGEGP